MKERRSKMAGELESYRKSSVAAHLTSYFLEVPTSQSTPTTKAYHLAFLRAESTTIETGVESETIADVTLKTQPTEVKSYSPTQAFNQKYLKSDPVCQYLLNLYDKRAVGGDVYCNHLEVRRWDTGNKAIKNTVSIAVESIVNEAGDTMSITGTYGFVGDPVEGTATVDEDTGIATFTPATSETSLVNEG